MNAEAADSYQFTIGVGMPALLHLEAFGTTLYDAFGYPAYLVGSALTSKTWRDVDVRLVLPDKVFAAMFGTTDERWAVLCAAISELARVRTGLPVDFQFQSETTADRDHREGLRIPLGRYGAQNNTLGDTAESAA